MQSGSSSQRHGDDAMFSRIADMAAVSDLQDAFARPLWITNAIDLTDDAAAPLTISGVVKAASRHGRIDYRDVVELSAVPCAVACVRGANMK